MGGPFQTASLRQCLHDLNRALQEAGLDVLKVSNTDLSIDPQAVETDVQKLEHALKHAELLDVSAGKPLLADIDLGNALDAWLTKQRAQVENRIRIAGRRLLADLDARGDTKTHKALNAAWQVWTGIDRHKHQIGLAILAFKRIDEVGGDLFLADTVVEELSPRLGGSRGLALAGRTSVEALANVQATIPEMAEKFAVTHFIEGALADHSRQHLTVLTCTSTVSSQITGK